MHIKQKARRTAGFSLEITKPSGTGENTCVVSPVPKETSMRIGIRRGTSESGDTKILSWR